QTFAPFRLAAALQAPRIDVVDPHALHAARIGIKHFDLEGRGTRNDLAATRYTAGQGDDVAVERVDILRGLAEIKLRTHHRHHVLEAGARICNEGAVRLAHDR